MPHLEKVKQLEFVIFDRKSIWVFTQRSVIFYPRFQNYFFPAHLEEDLNPVDEEEDDDDEHEGGVAAVEDVRIELAVLVVGEPHHAHLGHHQRVRDHVEHQEAKEGLQEGLFESYFFPQQGQLYCIIVPWRGTWVGPT